MMRYLIAFFTLLLLGCSSKPEKSTDPYDFMCSEETKEAVKSLKNDSIQLILINEVPRYAKELNELLRESNIQLRLVASMHGEGSCVRAIMDSVINKRFGLDFRKKIMNKADSLFFESNRNSIFPEQQLDERPALASNLNTSGQDEIIKRLNKKNLLNDSVEFISNIVNTPYFVVRFTVAKNGTSSNAKITERNSTDKYNYLEETIVNEINDLTEWSAGQVRNESVKSVIDVAIAVKEK